MADRHAARHADLPALSALATPLRRRLYAHVAAAETTTRDDAALAVGISRSLAAYHLDRLVSLGVLEIDRERIRRVGGPGAGRPPKRYRRARGGPVATESARASLLAVLTAQGYAPLEAGDGRVALRSCPFATTPNGCSEDVCALNVRLVEGIVAGIGAQLTVRLDPHAEGCCVALGSAGAP